MGMMMIVGVLKKTGMFEYLALSKVTLTIMNMPRGRHSPPRRADDRSHEWLLVLQPASRRVRKRSPSSPWTPV